MRNTSFKLTIFVAGGAFVLCVVSGLLAKISFFDIVIRALFLALLAGAFSWGGKILLQKTLPELFELALQKVPKEESSEASSKPPQEESLIHGFVQEMTETGGEEKFARSHKNSSPVAVADTVPFPQTGSENLSEPAEVEEAELLQEDEFLESFEDYQRGQEQEEGAKLKSRASSSPVIPFDDKQEHDPAILAKAIQTVLKKDE